MLAWLFLLFTVVPVVELYVLIQIGRVIGGLETVLGVIVIGMIGAAVAKRQGLSVLRAIQRATAEGRLPGRELVEGAIVLAAGILLITPGVVSDVAGVTLMLPPIRRGVASLLIRRFAKNLVVVGAAPDPREPTGPIVDVTPPKDPRQLP